MSLVVGFCGGSGSGKTTLCQKVYDAFSGNAVLVGMDNYYKDFPDIPFSERTKLNYDHPDIFDVELLRNHISALKNGQSVDMPEYNYTTFLREEKYNTVESKPLILVEGIMLFSSEELRNALDIKIFVDTDADARILRRILRDVKTRGRNLDWVISQYLSQTKPMHEAFVEPSKKYADLIVPEGGLNKIAVETIISLIKERIKL